MIKTRTLNDLIAETYTADEPKFFGYEDRGNGSAWPPSVMDYDDEAAKRYGEIDMQTCSPIKADNARDVEFVYASEWQDGENGYQFRVMF